ncbi:EI24 domain-containing protein [Magnetospira thiophila]
MIKAFSLAIGQLSDPGFRNVLWKSMGLALVVFVLLWMTIGFLLGNTALFDIGWLESIIDVLGVAAVGVLTWFLFPAVISIIVGFFLEEAAAAVDKRHYPHLPPARQQPISELIVTTVKFLAIAVVLNIFLLFFLIIPPLYPIAFYLVNGYLFGREYYELVALRRLDDFNALGMRRAHKTQLMLIGMLMAFTFTIPLVNLVAPLIATAAMVHLVEAWRHRSA